MNQITGLGDVVMIVLKFFGLKMKDDCGCEKRRKLLNKMFPFRFGRRT
ncbi:MAG: hypothetical protein AB8H03_23720 [Saprospiraceae bacterium]